ncbi:MAG: Ni/Fe-hydrogenase cytochrome b subunit [Azospirillum sp.]|nr:Ni/Fe-hydrogenase cytochrome b subunit [Azospirillum sp.]
MLAPRPLGGRIITPTFVIASTLALIAAAIVLYRLVFGLAAVTNLSDGYPWGIWIVADVMIGSAFGCAGYAVAILVYLFNRGEYHPLIRPALLASLFGYGLAGLAVIVDLGRWWQFYAMFVPWYMNPSSVMLETALCIAVYAMIICLEFAPAVLERFGLNRLNARLKRVMFAIVALGLLLPTMHQSSLGTILVILGHKLSPLWQTEWLPLLYLLSALLMGLGIVVFEAMISASGFRRPFEVEILGKLAGVTVVLLAAFLVVRIGDLAARGAFSLAFRPDVRSLMFWIELSLMSAPLVILGPPANRRRPQTLFLGAFVLLLGGIVYRVNSYLVGLTPATGNWHYFPTLAEIMVTLGLFSLEVVLFLLFVKLLPILPARHKAEEAGRT